MFNADRQHIVSIIPARGGSKGIPRKNIALLVGRPLLDYTIQASLGSRYIAGTYVTSDCDEILAVADRCGGRIIKRPPELATDTASSESAIMHAVNQIQAEKGRYPDVIILLQPTSPLRDSQDIDKAFETFFETESDALISGVEPATNPLKQMILKEDGTLRTVTDDPPFFSMGRQQLPRAFKPNGAIYIVRADVFLKTGSLLGKRTVPFYMDNEKSLDIDTPADMEEARRILTKKYETTITKE